MNDHLVYVTRLLPGQDLKSALIDIAREHNIQAGWIITCVGSLRQYTIRFANQSGPAIGNGYFEILSLSGTVSLNGLHLHICIADENGNTLGGHLLEGCTIYTTAEIVIGAHAQLVFTRENDGTTSWPELQVSKRGA